MTKTTSCMGCGHLLENGLCPRCMPTQPISMTEVSPFTAPSPTPWRIEWEMLGASKSPVIIDADHRIGATFPLPDIKRAEANARHIVELANGRLIDTEEVRRGYV